MRCGLATAFQNLASGVFRRLFIDVHERDECAFLRESLRNGLANPAGRTRNNCRLAFEPQAAGLLLVVHQSQAVSFRHSAISISPRKRGS